MSSPIIVNHRVRWGDCDPAGIAFYPRFFEWMDMASHDLHKLVGIHRGTGAALERGIPLVEVQAEFLVPAVVDDELVIRAWITRMGRTSMGLRYEFVRSADGTVLAKGRESRVHVVRNAATGAFEPQPLTTEMRHSLEPYLDPMPSTDGE